MIGQKDFPAFHAPGGAEDAFLDGIFDRHAEGATITEMANHGLGMMMKIDDDLPNPMVP